MVTRNKVTKTYLTEQQAEMLKKLTEKYGVSTSEFLKSLIIKEYYKTFKCED